MKRWESYTTKEIKPGGWLLRQLRAQAQGLCGHLHEIWPDIRDSAWIGGNREAWERVPYWLDGFIPLAFLLDDESMKATTRKYVAAILARQEADGWICPCKKEERGAYDNWAVQLIAKVLTVYYQCTGEEQALQAVYRILKNYYDLLKSGEIALKEWGKFRWFETFIAMNEVYQRFPEDWLKELARMLKEQGADYQALKPQWKRPLNKWTFETHIVNIMMSLKAEAVSHALLGQPYRNEAEADYALLREYNGTPVELFTGDECLSGLSPIQGTELCAVVEEMYSLETLFAYTGENIWMERLEKVAFNALPASISEDVWTHQYVQMSNQMACQKFPGKSLFRTNGSEAHLFGLEPNYGCCTANFGQGWPKLALSAFFHDENGTVLSALPIPSVLRAEEGEIRLETEYPFNNVLRYTVDSQADFTLAVRLPSFARNITIDGQPGDDREPRFFIPAHTRRTIEIRFDAEPVLMERPNGLKTVACGSLVFSVPVRRHRAMHEYERDGVERRFPYCDYELVPDSAWNYAFAGHDFQVIRQGVSDAPFSETHPPVEIEALLQRVDWPLEDGYETVCAKLPGRTPQGAPERLRLIPYGCAKLRMTELPDLSGERNQ